ncbi:MAG: tetratricopeptide repeat protein [Cyanobacteria bacterium P01_D01_bin.73]
MAKSEHQPDKYDGELVPEWAIVDQVWDVERLRQDLAVIKGQRTRAGQGPCPLSPTEMTFLRGTLFGANTRQIAQAMGRQENGIKTDLSKTVYLYLKVLLGYGEGVRYPKDQVLRLLRDRGYGGQSRTVSPQPPALDALKQVLPPGPASFVGRQEELDMLNSWLRSDRQGSALSVEGPGGIGKTALVQRALVDFFESAKIASDGGSESDWLSGARPMRLVFVPVGQQRLTSVGVMEPLGGTLKFNQVLHLIATRVGVDKELGFKLGGDVANSEKFERLKAETSEDSSGAGAIAGKGHSSLNWSDVARLNDALSAQPTVVFIDSAEKLPKGLLEQWLATLPWAVTVIVTSRERMALNRRIDLRPLADEAMAQLVNREAQNRALKLSKAQQGELIRVAQGMPLVVSYGLARVSLGLPLSMVLADLQDPLGGLVQFSVAPLLDRLWRSPDVQALLLALWRFPAGAIASLVYDVAGLSEREGDRALAELTRCSLLQPRDHRWVLWPLAQVYVAFLTANRLQHPSSQSGKLCHDSDGNSSDRGRSDGLEDAGLEPFGALLEALNGRWLAWGKDWLARHGDHDRWEWKDYGALDGQWGNLEALLDWCMSSDRVEDFWQLWPWVKGYTQLGGRVMLRKKWLSWASGAFEAQQNLTAAAAAYFDLGFTYSNSDTPDSLATAQSHFDRAWQWRDQCSDQCRVDLIVNQFRLAIRQGREEDASRWLATGWKSAEAMGKGLDQDCEVPEGELHPGDRLRTQLSYFEGEMHLEAGRLDEAGGCYSRARDVATATGWERATVMSEGWLGEIALRQGRLDQAEKLLKGTVQKSLEQSDRRALALGRLTLARVISAQGSDRRAYTLATESFKGFRQLGMELEMDQAARFIRGLSYKPANLSLLLDGEVDGL